MPVAAKHNSRMLVVLLKEGFASDDMFKCSGNLKCGHCAVELDSSVAGDADNDELALLASTGKGQEGFRCSCKLRVTEELEGKVVRLTR